MISSFEPIIDEHSKILILGTMPGVRSLEKKEYYGHERNAFWKIMFQLFERRFADQYAEKKLLLLENKVALWDVLETCKREGSSDTEIKEPVPNDFKQLFKIYPGIREVFFNGQPAEKLFRKLVKDEIGDISLIYHVLPSTSPANTMRYEEKYEKWKRILPVLLRLG